MNLDPQLLAVQQTADDEVQLRLDVPPLLACFADHFPGEPLLPGVVQLGWAVQLAGQQFGIGTPLSQVVQLKFQRPVRPGCELVLHLKRRSTLEIAFRYADSQRDCASGRLQFADPE